MSQGCAPGPQGQGPGDGHGARSKCPFSFCATQQKTTLGPEKWRNIQIELFCNYVTKKFSSSKDAVNLLFLPGVPLKDMTVLFSLQPWLVVC